MPKKRTAARPKKRTTAHLKSDALAAYREYAMITSACEAAEIGRTTWYRWLKEDEQFAADVDQAKEAVADNLEKCAIERATGGSDTLLIFLLKGHKPDKFKERVAQDVNISGDLLERLARGRKRNADRS